MNALLSLPIVLPLVGAAVSILGGRSRRVQRTAGLAVLTVNVGLAVALLVDVDRNGPRAPQGGGWPAPLGITLVADRLAALLLVVATSMLLAVLVYAIGQPGAERNHVGFTSVYLVLAVGVSAAFLTGDLFNLFVAIEMMLTASYVLITLGGRLDQVRAGMTYVVISLLASTLFMAVLAYVYAATGTVNLADLSVRIPELPAGTRAALAVAMLVVFGIKAALVPLHFWLPAAMVAPTPACSPRSASTPSSAPRRSCSGRAACPPASCSGPRPSPWWWAWWGPSPSTTSGESCRSRSWGRSATWWWASPCSTWPGSPRWCCRWSTTSW